MKLQYILGKETNGKLEYCINKVKEREEKSLPTIIIVPEQFTFEIGKSLIDSLDSSTLFNVQVLNFKRLSYRVFSEIGINDKKSLEEIGKLMIFRKILYKLGNGGKLKYFSEKSYSNIGVLEKISNTLKEMFEFDIKIENFEDVLEKIDLEKNENLALKICDLKEIYIEYKKYLQKEYITDETILEILEQKIDKSSLLTKDTEVYIYGFNYFNNQEINIINKIVQKTEKVNIFLPLNTNKTYFENIKPFDYYFYVKNTINKIDKKILCNSEIKKEEVIFLSKNIRHKNNIELETLEKNFLKFKVEKYEKDVENIKIFNCKNKYSEVEQVVDIVLSLIKKEGYKYKDIAVILGDLSYQKNIKTMFNKYKIPYFLDDKKKICNHYFVEFIISALDTIIYNFQYDNIFRYLRAGILDVLPENNITTDDIDIIENYVIHYGIKGEKWKREFKYGFYDGSPYNFEKINSIRETIIGTFEPLNFKKDKLYTVTEISKALIDFLLNINIEKTIQTIIERDKKLILDGVIKNLGIVDEYIQIFNSICEILQKFVDILGEEKLTLDEYRKILYTAFQTQKISIVPPTQDEIIIGDFSRTKITNKKVIICMGINEGNIPKYEDNEEFITDDEKVYLMARGFELNPTSIPNMANNMFDVYTVFCNPSDKLYLTYSTTNFEGNEKKPSVVIDKIKSIFINVKDFSYENTQKDIFLSPYIAFDNICSKQVIDSNIDILKDAFTWFLSDEYFAKKIDVLKNGIEKLYTKKDDYINYETLNEINKNNTIYSSVSKLELFRKCPFSYFLRYILNIKDREDSSLNYLKLGNMYHQILEMLSLKILKSRDDYENITKDDIYNIVCEIVEEICKEEEYESIFEVSPKYRYYINRIKQITSMSAFAIIKQLKEGFFEPEYFEIDFENIQKTSKIYNNIQIDLKDDYKMILKGKIDRVDKFNFEDKNYIKMVDYKSSDKKIELDKIYYGLQLQIIVYLDIFLKIEQEMTNKETLPAGAFYFKVAESVINQNDKVEKLDTNFNMKGIVNRDDNILDAFGTNEKRTKVKGVSGNMLSMQEFKDILLLSNVVIKEIGNNIITGNIKVKPYKYKMENGCDNCNYKNICNIEILKRDKKYDILKSLKDVELWEKINKKINKISEK